MALVLEENEFLSKLSSGDVASNELCYHKSCYKIFLSRYQQTISKKTKRQQRNDEKQGKFSQNYETELNCQSSL